MTDPVARSPRQCPPWTMSQSLRKKLVEIAAAPRLPSTVGEGIPHEKSFWPSSASLSKILSAWVAPPPRSPRDESLSMARVVIWKDQAQGLNSVPSISLLALRIPPCARPLSGHWRGRTSSILQDIEPPEFPPSRVGRLPPCASMNTKTPIRITCRQTPAAKPYR